MKKDYESLLKQLIASTRSPRGRYSAERTWPLLQARMRRSRLRHTLWKYAASAAAIAILCLAGWQVYEFTHQTELLEVTALADTRTVILPDRTTVTLNRYSTLTYPERFRRDGRREVTLSGGACFEVSKDTARPFVVNADRVHIQVLGTRFNVEAYPEDSEVRTTLFHGSVAISVPGQAGHMRLRPHEQARYAKADATLTRRILTDLTDEANWSRGILSFRQTPLHEIVCRLENAYRTDIRLADSIPSGYRITATFDADEPLTDVLTVLCAASGFRYSQEKGIITIY